MGTAYVQFVMNCHRFIRSCLLKTTMSVMILKVLPMNLLKLVTRPKILLMHGCLGSNHRLLVMLGILQDENLFAKNFSITATNQISECRSDCYSNFEVKKLIMLGDWLDYFLLHLQLP